MPNANSLNGFEDLDTKSSPLSASACNGIWLLDDDVSMLKALGRLMNSAGFIVEKFNLPAAFLARLEHAPCRVAILDVWMPQITVWKCRPVSAEIRPRHGLSSLADETIHQCARPRSMRELLHSLQNLSKTRYWWSSFRRLLQTR